MNKKTFKIITACLLIVVSLMIAYTYFKYQPFYLPFGWKANECTIAGCPNGFVSSESPKNIVYGYGLDEKCFKTAGYLFATSVTYEPNMPECGISDFNYSSYNDDAEILNVITPLLAFASVTVLSVYTVSRKHKK